MGNEREPRPRPVVLIVRDGWGRNPHPEHDEFNAVKLARTPRCDSLLSEYPWTLLHTCGEDVGLPAGTMGNSEVGHQNLGAGRIVDQESVRITKAIRDGTFFDNETLIEAARRGRRIHLLGIASDAGVHGLLEHLYACLELCRREGVTDVFLHMLTDGRDTGPFTGDDFLGQIEARCREIGVGRVVSICGRYWAMDRDHRWERIHSAYECLTEGDQALHFDTAATAIHEAYDNPPGASQHGDEFVTPRTVGADWADTRIGDGDTVIFYNYRGDRPRQITRAFTMDPFAGHVAPSPDTGERGFDRGRKLDLTFVTMTSFDEEFEDLVKVAFPKPPPLLDISGAYFAARGLTQFRCAETEKFPHVTFFYNDYREEPFAGERRHVAQSPRVATYDLKPEMSAAEVRDSVLARIDTADCEDHILVNFANPDMVGHTGNLKAAIRAVETVDECVGVIVDATLRRGGALIVTADHGNAEQMFDPETESAHTAHTTYDVECIVVDPRFRGETLRGGGRLADVCPTILTLMGLPQPRAMTGVSLLQSAPVPSS